MSEVKIIDSIIVDEPQNVEIAIYNLTGERVEFELIRKYILNEKNTMFYLDKKMNSSTDPGYNTDYLWLDTGVRDGYDNPIMICLHNGLNGYTGHYTGTTKVLAARIRTYNRKNGKDIEKNYSRFLAKYKKLVEKRENVCITNPVEYAINAVNFDVGNEQTTSIAMVLKEAGIEIHEEVVAVPAVDEIEQKEEEQSTIENEITVGLLVDQIENMQNYIDELLARIENHEKTSQEEIEILKNQNQEYKNALLNIRLFNAESETGLTLSSEEQLRGHNLLERNEKILILGNTDIKVTEMRAIAREYYGFEKADFEFITDYAKVKNAGSRVHNSSRFAAIIFGNCPHKVAGIGDHSSIIEEFKKRESCSISIDARTESGGLKITKQSFKNALNKVYAELKDMKVA